MNSCQTGNVRLFALTMKRGWNLGYGLISARSLPKCARRKAPWSSLRTKLLHATVVTAAPRVVCVTSASDSAAPDQSHPDFAA